MKSLEIFLDIDSCIIDGTYQFTAPLEEVRKKLAQYSTKMRFHLNSNRSLSSTLSIWNQVRFNGLIIYENGQGVFDPVSGIDACSPGIRLDRDELVKVLSQVSDKVSFISTDELIKNPASFVNDNKRLIYCEDSRVFTSTVYPRINIAGVPTFDREFMLKTLEVLRTHYQKDYDIQTSEDYGNIILTPRGSLKSNPMKKIAGKNRIASFGDQKQDILMFKESFRGLIGCPMNASQEVKDFVLKNGGFVSKLKYTSGLLEFLDYLSKRTYK